MVPPAGGWGGQGVERHAAACHRSPPEKEKAARARPLVLDRLGRKFLLCPLLSGYQVQHQNTPNIFERIRAEVVWNVGENFRTEDEKLDRFSTFGGFGGELAIWGGGRGVRSRPRASSWHTDATEPWKALLHPIEPKPGSSGAPVSRRLLNGPTKGRALIRTSSRLSRAVARSGRRGSKGDGGGGG